MALPKILKNSAIYTIIMVLQKGISFFLLPLYTAFLNPDDYGILSVVSSVSAFLSVFITLGLEGAATRFYYKEGKNEEYAKHLYGNIALIILANSILWGGLFICGHKWLVDPVIGEIEFYPYVLIGILNVIVTPLYLLYQNYLQTRQDGFHFGINSMCSFLLQVGLTVIALVVLDLGVLGVLLAQLTTAIIFFIYVLFAFLRKQTLRYEMDVLKPCLKYSLPLLPHTLANWSNSTLDNLLVNGIRTQADAGMYSLGQQYGSVMSFASLAVNQAYVPWFYEKINEGKEGFKQIRQVADIAIRLIVLLALVLSLFSKEVLDLMISNPAFNDVWMIVPCIVFAYVCQSIYFFFVNVLFIKNTGIIFTITITSVLVNIGFNLLLIPNWGYVGCAIACLLTYFTKSIMALIISSIKNKEIRFNWAFMYLISFIGFCVSLISLTLTEMSLWECFAIKSGLILSLTCILGCKYKKYITIIYSQYVTKTISR